MLDKFFLPVFPERKIFLLTLKLRIKPKSKKIMARGFTKPRDILEKPTISKKPARRFLSTKAVKILANKNKIVIIDLNSPPIIVKNLIVFFIMPPFNIIIAYIIDLFIKIIEV